MFTARQSIPYPTKQLHTDAVLLYLRRLLAARTRAYTYLRLKSRVRKIRLFRVSLEDVDLISDGDVCAWMFLNEFFILECYVDWVV